MPEIFQPCGTVSDGWTIIDEVVSISCSIVRMRVKQGQPCYEVEWVGPSSLLAGKHTNVLVPLDPFNLVKRGGSWDTYVHV